MKSKMNYVLIKGDIVLGTFGNLKKITDFVEDQSFPSYWTLVRKNENPIIHKDYRIYKVRHY